MEINDIKGKKITVMGLGLHGGGIGTVRFLHALGAKVIVTDIKSKEVLAPSLEKLKDLKGIEYILGQHRSEDFENVDMIIKTPPAPWNNKYIKLALEKKVPVEIDSSLFFKLCKNPIIGVTGTRGKTTTTSLIYEILKLAGKNPVKVGMGQISVLDKLNSLKKDSTVVFELSSWRLSALGRYKLSPQIAVVTNVYQDHLNYYPTMEEYIKDKKNIFLNQKQGDVSILNWDNEIVRKLGEEVKFETIKFSENKIENGKSVYIENGKIYFNNGIDSKKVLDLEKIKIRGNHNRENVMAAVAVAKFLGIENSIIEKTISDFKGIPHRLEFIKEIDGVKYYNDTAATSPDGAVCGINSFSEPVVLICGGSDKKLDMSSLAKVIAEKLKAVVFLKGEATEKIISALRKILPENEEREYRIVDSMAKAVELAKNASEIGDVVLLSPGAASFGLFNNEFDRGDKFRKAVEELK